jgi:lysophospholipase L1-like esterase
VARSRAGALAALAGAAGMLLAVPAAVATLRVRRMRHQAAAAPTLVLDLDLDGTAPARTVVVLGDSSSAGFRLTDPEQSAGRRVTRALQLRDGRATRLRSVARNGATTAAVLEQQVDAAAGADIVLLGVGANDAVRRVPTAAVTEALEALIGRIRELAAPDARIVLVGCPDLSVAPGLPRLARIVLRRHVRRIARVQARVARALTVPLVPLPRDVLEPAVFADDGFHPGALGHERVAARILDLL